MAFQIRRGTNSQRLGITPLQGELIYTTDTKALYVGDGTTAGGTSVGGGGGGGATYGISAETATGGVNLRLTGSDATTDDVKFAEGANITLTRTNASTITIASTGGSGTTYGISAETATGGVNLRLTGSDASTDDVKLAQGANITLTRTDANTITIAATGGGGGSGLTAVQDDPNPALGGSLDLNTHNVTGIGSINITGNITSTDITSGPGYFDSINIDQNYANSNLTITTEVGYGAGAAPLAINEYNDDVNGNQIILFRSRGTVASPLPVQANDFTVPLAYVANSSDGSPAVVGALGIGVGSTVGAGIVSGKFNVAIADTAGMLNFVFSVDENGIMGNSSTALVAGGGSGQVASGTVSTWMQVNFNGTDYAIPLYAINP